MPAVWVGLGLSSVSLSSDLSPFSSSSSYRTMVNEKEPNGVPEGQRQPAGNDPNAAPAPGPEAKRDADEKARQAEAAAAAKAAADREAAAKAAAEAAAKVAAEAAAREKAPEEYPDALGALMEDAAQRTALATATRVHELASKHFENKEREKDSKRQLDGLDPRTSAKVELIRAAITFAYQTPVEVANEMTHLLIEKLHGARHTSAAQATVLRTHFQEEVRIALAGGDKSGTIPKDRRTAWQKLEQLISPMFDREVGRYSGSGAGSSAAAPPASRPPPPPTSNRGRDRVPCKDCNQTDHWPGSPKCKNRARSPTPRHRQSRSRSRSRSRSPRGGGSSSSSSSSSSYSSSGSSSTKRTWGLRSVEPRGARDGGPAGPERNADGVWVPAGPTVCRCGVCDVCRSRQDPTLIGPPTARQFLERRARAPPKEVRHDRVSGQSSGPPRRLRREQAARPLRALAKAKKTHFLHTASGSGSGTPMSCGFCQRDGHAVRRCPATPTPVPRSFTQEQRAFTERILSEPRVDIEREFRGLSWEQARAKVTDLSARFNQGNPWARSEEPMTRDRLRARAGWWKAIGADSTVLSWVLCGARLPVIEHPLPLEFRNHPSYERHAAFVDGEVATAVAEGTFRPIHEQEARIVNPISVEPNKAGTKLRMCVDARWHNAHLPRMQFKLESIEVNLADVVKPGDTMLTTDISRAYYSVPIVEEDTPYLAIRHRGRLYAPTVLPFGSSLAPFIFNKITRTVVRFARNVGVRVLNFYDDFLWACAPQDSERLARWVQWFLPASGWLLNEKCRWTPSTLAEFLGFDVSSGEYEVRVTEARLKRAVQAIAGLRKSKTADRSTLESLIGQIVSMRPAVGPVQLFTRELYRALARTLDKDERAESVELHAGAREELRFWEEQLPRRNGKPITPAAAALEWRVDASEAAMGAVETQSRRALAHALPDERIGRSSTERELYAALHVVRTWGPKATGRVVRLCMDSFPATRNLVKGGGPVEELCELARQIWRECEGHAIDLQPEWVPREENTQADRLSKAWEDWYRLAAGAMERVCRLRSECKHSAHRHAPIVNVPFNQIRNALHTARAERRAVCVVYPAWPAQSWMEMIRSAEVATTSLGPVTQALEPPPRDSPLEGCPRWRLDASVLDFARP